MPRVSLAAAVEQRSQAAEFKVPSSRDSSVIYIVRREPDGTWSCDSECRGFKYRGWCRHIEEQSAAYQQRLEERYAQD